MRVPAQIGLAVAGIAGAGLAAFTVVTLATRSRLPAGVAPPATQDGVPFAPAPGGVVWPVWTNHDRRGEVGYVDVNGGKHGNQSRRFATFRDGHTHAGIDLYGYAGDQVLAIANGTVVRTQAFHLGTDAILVDHGSFVALYGEIERNSWKDFGIGVGSRVRRGQPIARIGCMVGTMKDCSSNMLHFETYRLGTTKNQQWTGSPPPALLDPTYLLLVAGGSGVNA